MVTIIHAAGQRHCCGFGLGFEMDMQQHKSLASLKEKAIKTTLFD